MFYVSSEIMPLISRVEHRPRVCVSHNPSINGLYSIIHVLPKIHASVLKSGICTYIYMFWPTMRSFSGRQNTRMSTSVEVSEPINAYSITFFWCRIILEIALDHDFFDNFSASYLSTNTLDFFVITSRFYDLCTSLYQEEESHVICVTKQEARENPVVEN